MIIHLNETVEYSLLTKILDSFNVLEEGEKLIIYFTCPTGGSVEVSEAIIHFINENKERIKIIFYGELFSSGMHTFLKTKCEKILLPETMGMYHFSYQQMSISEGGTPSLDVDKFCMLEMKNSRKKTLEFLKHINFTDKEIKQIAKGKDVYFNYSRMTDFM